MFTAWGFIIGLLDTGAAPCWFAAQQPRYVHRAARMNTGYQWARLICGRIA